ncbi:MAG: hypothetical protein ACKVOU_05440 [Cytophagales bacterium]
MKLTKLSLLLLVLISINGCDKNIELGNFDVEIWKNDHDGCKGERKAQLENLNAIKKQFEGMRETRLHGFLGKPNRQELKERNCKSYYYYIDKTGQCIGEEKTAKTPFLIVEMDALNRVMLMRFALE